MHMCYVCGCHELHHIILLLSDWSDSGTLKEGMVFSANNLDILSVFCFRVAKATYRVKRSCTITTCLFSLSIRNKSIMSIPRIWKAWDTRMGRSGGLYYLPVPVAIALSKHDFANATVLLNTLLHYQFSTSAE